MKAFWVVLLIMCCTQYNAQNLDGLPFSKSSDTTYWLSYANKQLALLDLPTIENSKVETFRLSSYGYVITIYRLNNILEGSINFVVSEEDDSKTTNSTFKKAIPLRTNVAQKLFVLLDSMKVQSIPSDKFIPQWKKFIDPVTFFFEHKTDSTISFKNYSEPREQNISEGDKIADFIDNFLKVSELDKHKILFEEEIPYFFYSYTGGYYTVMRTMTNKEYRDYNRRKKERKKKS